MLEGLELDFAGKTFTADALLTQRKLADFLHDRGAHFVFTAKGNQPTLLDDLRLFLTSASPSPLSTGASGHLDHHPPQRPPAHSNRKQRPWSLPRAVAGRLRGSHSWGGWQGCAAVPPAALRGPGPTYGRNL